MMRRTLPVLLLLAGCASSQYAPDTGHNFKDWQACSYEAHALFEKAHGDDVGGFLGPVGLLVSGNSGPGMSLSDIDPYVEKCMAKKGYSK